MREILLRILGIAFVAATAYLFLSGIQKGLTPFKYAAFPIIDSLVSTEDEIAYGVSYSLWDQRSLDVIALALLLFVSSACCATILGSQRKVER